MKSRKPTLTAAAVLAALMAQLDQAGAAEPTLFRTGVGSLGGSRSVNTVGAPATGKPAPADGTEAAGGALREQTLINSREALARTNRTRADIIQLQNAAHAAAIAGPNRLRPDLPDVPNGLTAGGLAVHRTSAGVPVRWLGAGLPTQSSSANGRIEVSVNQTASQALLNWETFNIGKQTHLHFDQSAGGADSSKWVAFNQVNDPTSAPSQILGSLTADGQVYVINRNGVIFGGSSQINTRGLTVSALPLNENLVERGLLNNPDSQFLFSGLALPAGTGGTPAFTPEAPHPDVGRYGDVLVKAGALLESALDAAGTGGRVALFGANVTNQGSIATPNGQTILAAGLQVGIAAHRSEDASLRGLDVYVGALAAPGTPAADVYAGTVTHTGLIDVPRGNASLAGRTLQLDGMIDSSTSVALNGRIDLVASYNAVPFPGSNGTRDSFVYRETGSVLLGASSVLRILPELDSTATAATTELALRSRLNVRGRAIHLGAGSSVLAPSAIANFDAGIWNVIPSDLARSRFLNAGGQIYLDQNALISVAGSAAVPVSVAQNFVDVELRGSELADSPLQRNSFLRGQTITVDIRKSGVIDGVAWVGTPLADARGFIGLIQRGVGELTTAAGEINLNAGSSIVMQSGSRLDVSGGWIDFQGATVSTTRLVRDGKIVDIAAARPDLAYDAFFTGTTTETSTRSGVIASYPVALAPTGSLFESGYVQGAAGGAINLTAASAALDGSFLGHVTTGSRQRDTLPKASSLALKLETIDLAYPTFPVATPHTPTVTFTTPALAPVAAFALDAAGLPLALRADRLADIHLSPTLFASTGLGALSVLNHGGNIVVPSSVNLTGPVGSQLTLGAANIDVQGSIVLPGGAIGLTAYDVSYGTINRLANSTGNTNPLPDPERGSLTVGGKAILSTAGRVIDESATAASSAASIRAGSISVVGHDISVAAGATLDVSGGVLLSAAGRITYGAAGSLTLAGGRDPNSDFKSVLGGSLSFQGARLLGHAGAGVASGSLSLLAPTVQIGVGAAPAGTVFLAPDFFSTGGFSTFNVTGIGAPTSSDNVFFPGVAITAGTVVRPVVENLFAEVSLAGLTIDRRTLAEGVRPAANLTFAAAGATDPYANQLLVRGELSFASGARIETDARGRVAFVDANTISIQGSIFAPGGTIEIRGGGAYQTLNPNLAAGVVTTLLDSTARLDVSGRYVPTFNTLGLRTGSVLPGGSITVAGNFLARAGAVLEASGTSTVLDLPSNRASGTNSPGNTWEGTRYVPVRIDSNGGRITLSGGQLFASDATLLARAGGADAAGGILAISSSRFYADGVTRTTADLNLTVSQSGPTHGANTAGIGSVLLAPGGNVQTPGGHFAADAFLNGGFDHLRIAGNVLFSGPVDLTSRGSLRVSTAGVIQSTAAVRLGGTYVALGQDFAPPVEPAQTPFLFTQTIPGVGESEYKFSPVHGTGRLTVDARHLDLGTLSLQQFGRAEFNTPSGDIRGNGFLNLAGDLVLSAGQIYPTTGASFTVTAFDRVTAGTTVPGSIAITQAGTRPDLPASAAGTLNLYASSLTQSGTLRAPFGVINLGRDAASTVTNPITGTVAPITQSLTLGAESLTSVSALRADGTPATLPYGVVLNGVSWIDPRGIDITLGGLPAKAVNLSAADIATTGGSVIDTRGGGDLFAYRFVPGTGGSTDLLASSGHFAVVPGVQPFVAPYAPFNPSPSLNADTTTNLGGDTGYVNTTLAVGDQVYLSGMNGLPAGNYTLLPARYALLPGAFLVTPSSTVPSGEMRQADGSSLVSGYRLNRLTGAPTAGRIFTTFEVASRAVVDQRATYQVSSANTFLAAAAQERGIVTPRLPVDAGRLAFSATRGLALNGSAMATAPTGGRGSQVDISSALDIVLAGPATAPVAGALTLSSTIVSQFGAASLLIGGFRTATTEGDLVTTTARNLTVDNAGASLTGPDLILVARETLTVAANASLRAPAATTTTPSAEPIFLGTTTTAGSGNGALVRITSSETAAVSRRSVGDTNPARLNIGASATLTGGSIVLDSSAASSLDASARLQAGTLALNSGRISLVLANAGNTSAAGGLTLSGSSLDAILGSARNLSLLSYSSLDLFGSGVVGSADFQRLTLSAPALRQFGSGDVEFRAAEIRLDNATARAAATPSTNPLAGTLAFSGNTVRLGTGTLATQGFATTRLNAAHHLLLTETGGLRTAGELAVRTPLVTAATGATQTLDATGNLSFATLPAAGATPPAPGLGAKLELFGAAVSLDSDIYLPSGQLLATARTGDLIVGQSAAARLDVTGTAQRFVDLTRVTDAGSLTLNALAGNVRIAAGSLLDVSAASAGGKAGMLTVSAPQGVFTAAGTLRANGAGGAFSVDTRALPATAALDAQLDAAGFNLSRQYRVRTGDVAVNGPATAARYQLSADGGSVTVTGTIDASGLTGGFIDLRAKENLTLASGAQLDVSAEKFSNAGKGGDVVLEAGAAINGVVSPTARLALQAGSIIDLSVASQTAGDAALGRFSGTLSLRTPLTVNGADVRIDPLAATILSSSYISVEGYRLYDLTATSGVITAVQNQIRTDATTFLGAAGTTTAGYTAMRDRLLSTQPSLADKLIIRPGAEIIHRTGDLTLGATNSTASSDWNLATYRFGPNSAPGALMLRAAGDLVFFNALSDGFFSATSSLWLSPLMAFNTALPPNLQSWDLRLTAGADFTATDFRAVRPLDQLAADKGSILLGKNTGAATVSGGANATTATLIANNFQVIRTGSGDIDLSAGRHIRLLNPFAAIYTAGTAVPEPSRLFAAGDFSLPRLINTGANLSQGSLGSAPQIYPAQYSYSGGDVTLSAQGNIERLTRNVSNALIPDSSRQLPNNWLYRRGRLDSTGAFGSVFVGTALSNLDDPSASTTWWVDFSNFFQSVGALGGGNVSLRAGQDVANVDAVIPTNARAASGRPDPARLVELGGGDLTVQTGRNLDGGVYYVQRGTGTLRADGEIKTNETRSLNRGILDNLTTPIRLPKNTWTPTALFVGDATFNLSARGDVLLGPIVNPHLLPQGNGNRFWYKTYFSTYGADAAVNVSSLTGDLTLRNQVNLPDSAVTTPLLDSWLRTQNFLPAGGNTTAAFSQPWLRLAETDVTSFTTLVTVLPPILRATSFSGDLTLTGIFNVFPSATGTVELLAAGALDGLSVSGTSTRIVSGQTVSAWASSRLNLSDTDPASLPSALTPLAYYNLIGGVSSVAQNNTARNAFLESVNLPFNETGVTNSVLQTRQRLHASSLLHRDDPLPLYLYATGGDLSGLTLFSAKPVRISASRDITDIAFYVQNTRADQLSTVIAGRDLIAYAPNSDLRVAARAPGNSLSNDQPILTGDIQISGPGTLQVLAGRNLDLGVGPSGSNGTSTGITSVGTARNPSPALPQQGADLVLAAGIGPGAGLAQGTLDYPAFVAKFLNPAVGATATRYLQELAALLPGDQAGPADTWTAFQALSTDRQAIYATEIFYRVLRDVGRDYGDPDAAGFRSYALGYDAIKTLFPGTKWDGDLRLTARQIKTAAGGRISLLVPGGGIAVGLPVAGARADQGILTEAGGDISIFTDQSVDVGTSRIFTLRGGDISIWSSKGDIAAGSAAKTVRSAPPTRVLIDPQSAAIQTDLSGLATGGGIGALATVPGLPPSDITLVAPVGAIDAGDAGIRSSGNLSIAAAQVLNAANITTGGASTGVPVPSAPALNLGSLSAASSAASVAGGALDQENRRDAERPNAADDTPSLIRIEVLGFGGGDEDEEDKKQQAL